MKIGFVFYSESGHTLSVLNQLEKVFQKKGHFVEKISLLEGYDIKKRVLTFFPKVKEFEFILFASPVQAFSLSIAMSQYLKQVQLKESQKVGFLLTQYFKKPFWGGNRAIKQMKNFIQDFHPIILGEGIVHWSSKERDTQISSVVDKLGSVLDE